MQAGRGFNRRVAGGLLGANDFVTFVEIDADHFDQMRARQTHVNW